MSLVTPIMKFIPRPSGCGCGDAVVDKAGNVLKVRTCPVCLEILLDSMRGVCYGEITIKDGDVTKRVLLKQKEFFSLDAYVPPAVLGSGSPRRRPGSRM